MDDFRLQTPTASIGAGAADVCDPAITVQSVINTAQEIARTTTALKSATTDAEVQKLTGVLIGLSSALNNTDYEIDQATASALLSPCALIMGGLREIPPGMAAD